MAWVIMAVYVRQARRYDRMVEQLLAGVKGRSISTSLLMFLFHRDHAGRHRASRRTGTTTDFYGGTEDLNFQ